MLRDNIIVLEVDYAILFEVKRFGIWLERLINRALTRKVQNLAVGQCITLDSEFIYLSRYRTPLVGPGRVTNENIGIVRVLRPQGPKEGVGLGDHNAVDVQTLYA
jgi:hypothetical protein